MTEPRPANMSPGPHHQLGVVIATVCLLLGAGLASWAALGLGHDRSTPSSFTTSPNAVATGTATLGASASPSVTRSSSRSVATSNHPGSRPGTIATADPAATSPSSVTPSAAAPAELILPTLDVQAAVYPVTTADGILGVPDNPLDVWAGGAVASRLARRWVQPSSTGTSTPPPPVSVPCSISATSKPVTPSELPTPAVTPSPTGSMPARYTPKTRAYQPTSSPPVAHHASFLSPAAAPSTKAPETTSIMSPFSLPHQSRHLSNPFQSLKTNPPATCELATAGSAAAYRDGPRWTT